MSVLQASGLSPSKGDCLVPPPQHFYSQVLDARRTAFSSKHIIRRRPWASPCLFLLFLMSLSWLNCVPHQNHVSVTALAARARGCDCVWREGLKGGDEGTRSRDRSSPSVAGDLYQNRQGHRHMEGWVCGPGTVLSLGSVTGSLCPLRPGPLGWGGTRLLPPLHVQPWRLALLVRTPVRAGVHSVASSKALPPNSVAFWVRGGQDSNI